ncbi:MAG: hypothetical protein ABIO46_15825 [Chitinophagales bacterium]
MTLSTFRNSTLQDQLLLVIRVLGLFLVIAVNSFVFITDHSFKKASSFHFITEFVNHANEDHQVNNTPFTLILNFKSAPLHLMDTAPAFPVTLPQFTPGILWLMVFGLMISSICFCFFRGEENMNTQFIPGIVIPPPKSV